MNENIIIKKSFDFAKSIIDTYKHLVNESNQYILANQLLKSGTSIGANITEAVKGQTKKDFLSKMYIAAKETEETLYWLNLLSETNYINSTLSKSLLEQCGEIARIINSIIRTTKTNLEKQ